MERRKYYSVKRGRSYCGTGKNWVAGGISKGETTARREGHIHYVVRIPTEADDVTEHDEFVADINCIDYEGERSVHTVFDQSVNSDQIEWEDWKQQMVFTTLLYGGFENEEDVYRAFLEKEHPDGQTEFGWEAQFSEGYCKVFYSYRSNTTYDEDNFPVENQSAFLDVAIYESYELYQKLKK